MKAALFVIETRKSRAERVVAPLPLSTTTSVLEMIRNATRDRHGRLEAMPSQMRLLRDDYRVAEYRSLLQRLYGFYDPLQSLLRTYAHTVAWHERIAQRTLLLERDLHKLGTTPADLQDLARCEALPAVDTPDRALGCAYVLEGATLGGRVISKHLARVFRDRADAPYSFFSGDGERTAERFREWCATLDATAADGQDVCRSACATFDAVSAWLADPLAASLERSVG
jgi:heme oxygenase